MAFSLSTMTKLHLDRAVILNGADKYHKFSDMIADIVAPGNAHFANTMVVQGLYATPGAGLNVNITGGFVRKADGTIAEIAPGTNVGTATDSGAAGQSQVVLISINTAGAFVATASAFATTPTVPATPTGNIAVCTFTYTHLATTLTQANINNAVRTGL